MRAVDAKIHTYMQQYSAVVKNGIFEVNLISSAPMLADMNFLSGYRSPLGGITVQTDCLNTQEQRFMEGPQ